MPGIASTRLTDRDIEILIALNRCPLTIRQLVALSATFHAPFRTERKLRKRLRLLVARGWIRQWPYIAIHSRWALNSYTLALPGYRMLYGVEAIPPKHAFRPVGIARQYHSLCLADFLVHTLVAAGNSGIRVTDGGRENAVCLTVGDQHLYPDGAFTLHLPDQRAFRFFVEIDNHSERVHTTTTAESWDRKIAFYERYQDSIEERVRVLAITTRARSERIGHILDRAKELARVPERHLVYGITLPAYVQERRPLTNRVFLDHHGRGVSLVPVPAARPALRADPAVVDLATTLLSSRAG